MERRNVMNLSNPTSSDDATVNVIVHSMYKSTAHTSIITVRAPYVTDARAQFGLFYLVRCGHASSYPTFSERVTFTRRPLYLLDIRSRPDSTGHPRGEESTAQLLDLYLPPGNDIGHDWLAARKEGDTINLSGPWGSSWSLPRHRRFLLAIASADLAPLLLPVMHAALDQGARVSLLLYPESSYLATFASMLPLSVEVHTADTEAAWAAQLNETIPWADQIVVALPSGSLAQLTQQVKVKRFRLEPGFLAGLIHADYVCGFGACSLCAIPSRQGGFTRACVHGPVFDLAELYG
jgi:dihydroorotate dehydrogenase electron transfer subunit